jgi:precorrin-6Y C5,15-methyltransferase (decarboxylating)
MKTVSIIGMGMGPEDLTARHKSIVERADILVGGRRLLEQFKDIPAQKKPIGKDIEGIVEFVRTQSKHHKVVVLASGDPLFYGIGARMAGALGARRVRIYPNISSVAAGFARIKEPWNDAAIISLHGRKNDEQLFSALESENKIAVFTDPQKNPAWLAARLIEKEFSNFKICVLEALGSASERFDWYPLETAAGMKFAEPNMVVLKRGPLKSKSTHQIHPGAPDNWYDHPGGLITKSLFIKKGKIIAVEKNPDRIENIKNNRKRFKVPNLKIVQAILPEGLSGLARPDRIFIGGGGRDLKAIVTAAAKCLKPGGRIVINTVLIPNLQAVMTALSRLKFETEVIQVQINRSRQMPWAERFEAQNPVWIVTGIRKAELGIRRSEFGK